MNGMRFSRDKVRTKQEVQEYLDTLKRLYGSVPDIPETPESERIGKNGEEEKKV